MEVCGLKIKQSEQSRLHLAEQYTNLKTTLDKTKVEGPRRTISLVLTCHAMIL